jgi:hypothetical protein
MENPEKPKGKRGGRKPGSKNKKTIATKQQTQEFFDCIVPDKWEARQWKRFLKSKNEKICWEAFKLAVAYKRGKPIERSETSGADGAPIPIHFVDSCGRMAN